MGLVSWVSDKVTEMAIRVVTRSMDGVAVELDPDNFTSYVDAGKYSMLAAEEFTIHAAISLIANCISKCEFKTFKNGKEIHKDDYYDWNYEPNRNQNSSQFLQELVARLLYDNECLVVVTPDGQYIIAESFSKDEYCLKDFRFMNVYRDGLMFEKTFYMGDVLYFRLNSCNIRRLLTNLCTGYAEILQEAVDKYEKAGGEKGTLKIDAVATGQKYGSRTFEEVYEDLMNNRFKKFFDSRNAVLPLFNGFTYTKQASEQSKKSTSEIKDITDVLDEITETVARAFNIPVSLLKGDVSDVQAITKNFLTFCIDPICEMIQTEITRKLYGRSAVKRGNYLRIDTSTVMHTDVFDVAEQVDKLISSGMYCIDELRRKLGDTELGTKDSQKHWITKNYEGISDSNADPPEGGEKHEGKEDEV